MGDAGAARGTPSVFIVEDEEALREVYSGFLPLNGFEVVGEAVDGADAVQKVVALERRPDVILMDHRMPRKSGIEASREILARDPQASILLVTADMSVEKQARAAGAREVLVKPFAMAELAVALRKLAAHGP